MSIKHDHQQVKQNQYQDSTFIVCLVFVLPLAGILQQNDYLYALSLFHKLYSCNYLIIQLTP